MLHEEVQATRHSREQPANSKVLPIRAGQAFLRASEETRQVGGKLTRVQSVLFERCRVNTSVWTQSEAMKSSEEKIRVSDLLILGISPQRTSPEAPGLDEG